MEPTDKHTNTHLKPFSQGDVVLFERINSQGNRTFSREGEILVYNEHTTVIRQEPPAPWEKHEILTFVTNSVAIQEQLRTAKELADELSRRF